MTNKKKSRVLGTLCWNMQIGWNLVTVIKISCSSHSAHGSITVCPTTVMFLINPCLCSPLYSYEWL